MLRFGVDKRFDGYLEGNGYIVSWCVGHLVELSQPEVYNESYAKWRLADLPILPDQWQYQVSESAQKQIYLFRFVDVSTATWERRKL